MARLQALEPEAFDPVLKSRLGESALANRQGLGLLRVLALRPDLTEMVLDYRTRLAGAAVLPVRLIELVRLRVAFHNQCRSCMALRSGAAVNAGVTEDVVCMLERPQEAEGLSEPERAALAYADCMATDHLLADKAMFDRLRLHFSEPEIVELGIHLARFVGMGRLSATWDIVDDLPERFHDREQQVTPWDARDAVVANHR